MKLGAHSGSGKTTESHSSLWLVNKPNDMVEMSVGAGRYIALVILSQWFTHCIYNEMFVRCEELLLANQTMNSVLFPVTLVLLTFTTRSFVYTR